MKHIFLTDSSELWMKFIPHRNVAQGPQIETVKKREPRLITAQREMMSLVIYLLRL